MLNFPGIGLSMLHDKFRLCLRIGRAAKIQLAHNLFQVDIVMRQTTSVISNFATAAICAVSLGGCTYQSVATSTASPSAAVDVDRFRNAHAGFYLSLAEELRHVESERIGHTCSSHKYPVSIESALIESINNVMQASFTSHQQYDSPVMAPTQENGYSFEIEVDDFEARLGYSVGTWTGSAYAEASLDLNIVAVGPDGDELTRTTVSGDGSGTHSGGCSNGSRALAEAASEAVEEAVQVFVYKVINSPRLDLEEQDADSLAADLGADE